MAKIIFYSVQTGNRGFIPSIKEQAIPELDYWFAHENHFEAIENKGWNYIDISQRYLDLNSHKKQRLLKMIPRLLFQEFDYSVYVDPKFYQHKNFYTLCLNIIEKENPDWMVCLHKENRTFEQELSFSINHKGISEQEIKTVIPHLNKHRFFSTDCCWLIRKNTDKNHEIGHQWFDLTNKLFSQTCRDQLTFSMCVEKNYLNTKHTIDELEKYSIIRHV